MMSVGKRPPFRADHVGSLLRPPELAKARSQGLAPAELKKIEDRCIREIVAMQEAAGMEAVTDGELRRAFWHTDFLTGFEGIAATQAQYAITFKNAGGETDTTKSMLAVTGKVRRTRPVMVDHFKFLKGVTKRTAKLCIPAPTYLHMRGGRHTVSEAAYPDLDEFWADITRAYRDEIRDLVAAGCDYLQFDDVSFAVLCDEKIRAQVRRDGEDPDRLPGEYVRIINGLIAGRPPTLGVTLHTCRGNHKSMWMAEGGYDAVAEALLGGCDVDGFFLEYDTDRAGGFEPLRFLKKGKKVVLGLVSSKLPKLEEKSFLIQRIKEASRYVPLENLCISPQCGFASSHFGNRITPEVQRAKLQLVADVAREVWG